MTTPTRSFAQKDHYSFCLYVSGHSPNSMGAIKNLNAICEKYLLGRHDIEIVDVLQQPSRPLPDGVLVAPTLLKLSPTPIRTIIGNLSDVDTVLASLGLVD